MSVSQSSLEEVPSNPPTVPVTPSLLSLTAPKIDEAGPRASRSESFSSRSVFPTRPASPVVRPIEDNLSPSVPNPLERNSLLRNHLHDLLTDTPPNVASSLPSSVEHHSSYDKASNSSHRSSPRRLMPSRSLENSAASLSPAPIPIPSVQPTTSITIAGSIHPNSSLAQRPALSRASSHAVAMENAQREKRKSERTLDPSESSREPVMLESSTLLSTSPSNKMSSSPHPYTSFPDTERSRQHQPGRRSPSTLNVPRDNNEYISSSPVPRYGPSEPERSHTSRPIGISHSSSKRDLLHSHKSHESDGNPSAFAFNSLSRTSSTSTPFKTGRPSRERDAYPHNSSLGSSGKDRVHLATMTATAGFA
ncbi:hypothetical protein F5050DRAFT_1131155 [Lentinula boryana]|uniref:Proteophosphoglycan ppg4 n=1 Tax=Lentinula boryana TaxID=40481 RepID=A0ABQ8PYW9_9AGAR|nr:hypothetical protein F5050DRAFT_1131155 [Lentinula boryana]